MLQRSSVSRLHRDLRLSCVCFQKYLTDLKYTQQHTRGKIWRKTLGLVRSDTIEFQWGWTGTKTLHPSSSFFSDESSKHCRGSLLRLKVRPLKKQGDKTQCFKKNNVPQLSILRKKNMTLQMLIQRHCGSLSLAQREGKQRKLDRWKGVLMEGEGEVWRSQGWIVFLFESCKQAPCLCLMSTAQKTSHRTS